MLAPFDIHHAKENELAAPDQVEFHSERELEIYRNKGELGSRTRLANLLAKKSILQKMNLPLAAHASELVIDRLSAQGFGYGMPVVHLSEALQEKWRALFGEGRPHVSLSHEGDRFVAALTNQLKATDTLGVDVMGQSSIMRLYRKGALTTYLSEAEQKTLAELPESEEKSDYVLALWCLKEAVFKAIASENLLGAHNRFRYIQSEPQAELQGPWRITILDGDKPLQFKGRWYPRLKEIFHDRQLDPAGMTASFQKIDTEFGLAIVKF